MRIALFLLALWVWSPTAVEDPPAKPALFARPAVMGASASNGFGLKAETGGYTRMAHFVDAALGAEHAPTLDSSDSFFFWSPMEKGRAIAERVRESEPTVVLALDFLFWFAYGTAASEPSRERRLEEGLFLLDRLPCTLLVGDVPYMPQAVGKMISAEQLPEAPTLERINARIRAWCDERPRAVLVPVAEFAERAGSDGGFKLGGLTLDAEQAARLLQADRLHPTAFGTASLVVLALDRLAAANTDVRRDELLLNPRELADRVLASEKEKAEAKGALRARSSTSQ
jgi:hypothetical protein